MTTLPRSLLVSDDADLTHLYTKDAQVDPVSQVVRLSGNLQLSPDKQGQLRGLLRAPSPEVLKLFEWTTRSFKARVGFDIADIHMDEAICGEGGTLLMEANIVLYPGEDRLGNPMRNPLLEILPRLLAGGIRLKVMRLFCRAGAQPFGEDRIRQEIAQQRLRLHPDARIMKDGVILPVDPSQFPLRPDLMEDRVLERGLAGFGRGVIDELQPEVTDTTACIAPNGYHITSTQFSLGPGRRSVLASQLVDLQTGETQADLLHGNSKLWDGGRTAGVRNKRHLELASTRWASAPLFDEVGQPTLGAKVSIYPGAMEGPRSTSVSMTSVPNAEYHLLGYTVTHWLRGNGKRDAPDRVRATLRELENGPDWGVLVGPDGMRPVALEKHQPYQASELQKQVTLYGRHGGSTCPKYPVAELGDFLRQVGNHMQRTALFCREMPPPKIMQALVAQGVRIVFTGNVSGKSNRIYLTNNQLQHYKSLARDGDLQLYLATPTRIRQLWNDLFVDIHCLEKIGQTDVRIGCYGASATNGEELLKRGFFKEALEEWMQKHPRTALVTGAAKNGAMGYMNKVASELGILTVGVGNEMHGQEIPDDELDAFMAFHEDDFDPRQALMLKINTHPLVGPGAEGSVREGTDEKAHRKTGKTCLTPIPWVDSVGLGTGGTHMYAPLQAVQATLNQPFDLGDGRQVVLSRAPYVTPMNYLVKTYREAMQVHADFMEDPQKYWTGWGVPDHMLRTSIERTLRDSEATGFPFPSFLKSAASRLGVEVGS